MSKLLRAVIETTQRDHEAVLAWNTLRSEHEAARVAANGAVLGNVGTFQEACEAIETLERLQKESQALAAKCDRARIAALRAHAVTANELGLYAKG
jgi:hypothetical protein